MELAAGTRHRKVSRPQVSVEEPESTSEKHASMRRCMDLLNSGTCTIEAACARVGIGRTTFYRWMSRARDPLAAPIFRDLLSVAERAKARVKDSGSTAAQLGHTKLSEEMSNTFVSLLKNGTCTREVACLSVGIGRTTFYRWLERARKPDAPPHFRDFLAAIEHAQSSMPEEPPLHPQQELSREAKFARFDGGADSTSQKLPSAPSQRLTPSGTQSRYPSCVSAPAKAAYEVIQARDLHPCVSVDNFSLLPPRLQRNCLQALRHLIIQHHRAACSDWTMLSFAELVRVPAVIEIVDAFAASPCRVPPTNVMWGGSPIRVHFTNFSFLLPPPSAADITDSIVHVLIERFVRHGSFLSSSNSFGSLPSSQQCDAASYDSIDSSDELASPSPPPSSFPILERNVFDASDAISDEDLRAGIRAAYQSVFDFGALSVAEREALGDFCEPFTPQSRVSDAAALDFADDVFRK